LTFSDRGELYLDDAEPDDEWDDFRGEDAEPIGIQELGRLDLSEMADDVHILIMDNYFSETNLWREGDFLVCEIQEYLYIKFWQHKFSAYVLHVHN
jgi:hypothetical protein